VHPAGLKTAALELWDSLPRNQIQTYLDSTLESEGPTAEFFVDAECRFPMQRANAGLEGARMMDRASLAATIENMNRGPGAMLIIWVGIQLSGPEPQACTELWIHTAVGPRRVLDFTQMGQILHSLRKYTGQNEWFETDRAKNFRQRTVFKFTKLDQCADCPQAGFLERAFGAPLDHMISRWSFISDR
jgi:hypothetical protein